MTSPSARFHSCRHAATSSLLLASVLTYFVTTAVAAAPFLETQTLFESGQGGYERYRIPGIAITAKGTILVTCDARKDTKLGDWSDIDLFLRRSPDLGKTWEAPVKLGHRGAHP